MTSFFSLPREIRDQIHDLHLQMYMHETWNRALVPLRLDSPGFLDEVHPQIYTELVHLYLSRYVEVDTKNLAWFRSWLFTLTEAERASIRELTILSHGSFNVPRSLPGTGRIVCRGEVCAACKPYADLYLPYFRVKAADGGCKLVVTSYFALEPQDLAMLKAQLTTVLTHTLQAPMKPCDGIDLVEFVPAFVDKNRVLDHRIRSKKRDPVWCFKLTPEEDFRGIDCSEREVSELIEESHEKGSVGKHVLFRAVASKVVLEDEA